MDNRKDIVIDTDTFNEVDDQFAITYAMLSQDTLNIKAFYAAPFFNKNSSSPKDGMERSYHEIIKVMNKLNIHNDEIVYHGSEEFLKNETEFVESEAARHLVDLALHSEKKLYVVCLAALTNIASAILMEPRIVDKISVIWLGGHDFNQVKKNEFNLREDVAAVRVVFNSGVELTQIPCLGVINGLVLTLAELEKYVEGKNEIGTYLTEIMRRYAEGCLSYSRTISDLSAVIAVAHPEWLTTIEHDRPQVEYDFSYSFDNCTLKETKVIYLDRNQIIGDLLDKIAKA